MFNYSLKISILIELWKKCPFSQQDLIYTKFTTSEIQIDHIFSLPRKSKNQSFMVENINYFESAINLRPLYQSHHIDFHSDVKYKSDLKFNKNEFLRICEELKDRKFEPLLMKRYYSRDIMMSLLDEFWERCGKEKEGFAILERPDWHIS